MNNLRYLGLILLAFLSMFPYLGEYQFRGEEALRTIVAFEMHFNGNWTQPEFLGEKYYNKPPLFNWFIILSSKVLSWSEISARAVTLFFLLLTTTLTFFFGLRVLGKTEDALLSALIFVTFSDVLFWYGYLAEIDITLTFFVTANIFLIYLYFENKKGHYLAFAGFLGGVSFLLKGFPAFAFFFISLLALSMGYKRFPSLKDLGISILTLLAIPALWLLSIPEPQKYVERLIIESLIRAKSKEGYKDYILHILSYPLLNIKQTLPASLILIIYIFKERKRFIFKLNEYKPLVLVVALNYVPYILSPQAKGRYVIPLFPLIAILMTPFIREYRRFFEYIALLFIFARFAFGIWIMPVLEKQRGPIKETAYKIANIVGNKPVACDCLDERKAVCLYLGFLINEPVRKPAYVKDWEFLVVCNPVRGLKEIERFHIRKGRYIHLYKSVSTFSRACLKNPCRQE